MAVELVRDVRSSLGYIEGDFQCLPLDIGSSEFHAFLRSQKNYDYVLNLSALKHVRSEKDPFTLMRMIKVNIINTIELLKKFKNTEIKKYFCVSTDKATNPVNMMGASKKIMETFLFDHDNKFDVSTARFANVAFSDGSLLSGFEYRIKKNQPIAAPNDIKRFFVTEKEAGQLCLMSTIFGSNKEIYFPKENNEIKLISFTTIVENYLKSKGLSMQICATEEEAREYLNTSSNKSIWPCYFFDSDTTGEKLYEEFYTSSEKINFDQYKNIGIVEYSNSNFTSLIKYEEFLSKLEKILISQHWEKQDLVDLFKKVLPDFNHEEKFKYLDQKM